MEDRIYPGKTGMFEAERKKHEDEILLSKSPYDVTALKQMSYSTDAQAVKTQIARTPATQYLTLNSADRNQTSTVVAQTTDSSGKVTILTTTTFVRQPWNRFKLQRPQNIMNTYATRMLVSEINFPWYVPNINPLTNTIYILTGDVLYTVTLSSAFLTGAIIAATLTELFLTGESDFGLISPGAVSSGNVIAVAWNPENATFTLIGEEAPFSIFYTNPATLGTESNYYSNTSLAYLMGFEYSQVIGVANSAYFTNSTTLEYTQYVDIVSDKLHQYSTNRDGSSDNFFGRNTICRLYIADEASNIVQGFAGDLPVQFIPGVSGSFIIHRQFKNPKAVMWNKEASVDWLDIAVYDQFGNLVPLPPTSAPTAGVSTPVNKAWPDFQITLLASEN